jgi:hypothetical protein
VPIGPTGNAGNLCGGTSASYTVRFDKTVTDYHWTVPANASIASGQGTDSIAVNYTAAFAGGTVSVTTSNLCATSAAASIPVTAVPATPKKLNGFIGVTANQQNIRYYIYPRPTGAATTGVTYTWAVPADATIKSGQGTSLIYVNWGSTSGNVDVYATNACGSSGVLHTPVTVLSSFAAPSSTTAAASASASSRSGYKSEEMVMYPNPATDRAQVFFTAAQGGKYAYEVTDVTGKVIVKNQVTAVAGNNNLTIDVSRFLPGVYMVMLHTGDKQLRTFKLVKTTGD